MVIIQSFVYFTLLYYVFLVYGEIIVQTRDGKIKGITQQTRAGVTYYEFLGVKYGQNPTDKLRFQPPKPVQPWSGTFDATVEKGICYQVPKDDDMETEDCLLLNLFTPANLTQNTSATLPVMVFIHGGGFIQGSGIIEEGIGPNFFMDNGLILVSINYRVGPFGFISTGDDVIPGNIGMKDQILALQWVQKNIASFGGDPDKVTIFGESAGGASVSYLLLSPLAEGLFRGAIMESGSALSPWAYQRNQIDITYHTAALLNPEFNTNRNSTRLLEFLQSVSAKLIDEASANVTAIMVTPGNYPLSKGCYYTPVIEHEHKNSFLSQFHYGAFEKGNFTKVPVLMGFNAEESLFMLDRNLHSILKAYDGNTTFLVPFDMHISDQDLLKQLGDKIKKFYSPDKNLEDNELGGIQFHSTHDFDKSIIKQAELQAPYVPVYLYYFTYRGIMGNNHKHLNGSGNVIHGEETNYIFSRWLSQQIPDNTDLSKFPQDDINVHKYFMTLFTNFAKELNPTPRHEKDLQNVIWPTVQKNMWKYLEISKDLIVHQNAPPKNDMWKFWNNLYDTYAVRPYDTF